MASGSTTATATPAVDPVRPRGVTWRAQRGRWIPVAGEVVQIGTFGGLDKEGSAKALAAVRKWSRDDAGLPRRSIESTIDSEVEVGNIEANRKPSYEDFVDTRPYSEALGRVGSAR